jgi:hypothetical protein
MGSMDYPKDARRMPEGYKRNSIKLWYGTGGDNGPGEVESHFR